MAYSKEELARIRTAGVVQAVIASGAPIKEWESRSRFGLRMVNHVAALLQGKKNESPKIPDKLKES